ncbi:hypothetical protein HBB16_19895 [Pseudonocardia sp. MCCB 268]|nr:hypothetical protein [Pseudonocardia cytotoxica]
MLSLLRCRGWSSRSTRSTSSTTTRPRSPASARVRQLTRSLGFADDAVRSSVSALVGDNVTTRSDETPGTRARPLLEHLRSVPVEGAGRQAPFRLPVQYVIRPRAAAGAGTTARLPGLRRPGRVRHRAAGTRSSSLGAPHHGLRGRTADGPLDGAGAGLQRHHTAGRRHRAPRAAHDDRRHGRPPEVLSEARRDPVLASRAAGARARLLLKHGTRTAGDRQLR